MINRTTVQVFLASPMDLAEERQVVRRVVDEINGAGRRVGVTFEVIGWETDVSPDAAEDAQDVVNAQIRANYDVFVCMFRDRLGTPTKRSASGTVEEYERAVLRREAGTPVRIMAYFLAADQPGPEIEQLKRRMAEDGVLYGEVSGADDLRATLYRDLNLLLLDYARASAKAGPSQAGARGRHMSSVGIIDCDGRLLLVKRSSRLKVGAGLWQVPGGKLEEGETCRQAAVREMREELGVTLDEGRLAEIAAFEDADVARTGEPFTLHLFCYRLQAGERFEPRLNEENERLEWVDLTRPLGTRTYLGINARLVKVLWREENGIAALDAALARLRDSDGMSMCDSDEPDGQALAVLGVMSALGLVSPTTMGPTSNHADKVMGALVALSRADRALFERAPGAWERDLRLSAIDHKTLLECQRDALRSHRSLLTALSCKTQLPNSVRDVVGVVVFGELEGCRHLLLRWDNYSNKYQLISSGLESVDKDDLDACANHALSRRVSPFAASLFSHVLMARFTTHHFASGSVDDDPILRRYNVTVLRAQIRAGKDEDFLEAVRAHNELNHIRMEYLPVEMLLEDKELGLLEWAPLDELLDNPTSYKEKRVQGFAEIIDAIGKDAVMRFSSATVHLG